MSNRLIPSKLLAEVTHPSALGSARRFATHLAARPLAEKKRRVRRYIGAKARGYGRGQLVGTPNYNLSTAERVSKHIDHFYHFTVVLEIINLVECLLH